jgi:hypothetical protein
MILIKGWPRFAIAAFTAMLDVGLIVDAPVLVTSASAVVISVPVRAASAHLVSTSMSPMATTNGKVDALAYANGVVYAGGLFTRMRFKGRNYFRPHIGAVHGSNGAPTSFRPGINGEVMTLALSPDDRVLYVGGRFTAVGQSRRADVAAFSTATGKLTSFAPLVTAGSVRSIAVTSTGVYLGGTITKVDGHRRTFAAEVTTAGKLTPWAPVLDGWVRAMLIAPDRTRIFLGGGFHHVNGVTMEALASVSSATGANEPFRNGLIPTYQRKGKFSQVTSFSTNGTLIFVGAEGTGWHAFDGTLAFNPRSGRLVWRNTCLGATQAVQYLRGVLYKASHAHNCSSAGGFGQIKVGWQAHHLLAEKISDGKLMTWGTSELAVPFPLPNTNGGLRNLLGPFAFAAGGGQLFVGGEFTTVNYRPHEGLGRFG